MAVSGLAFATCATAEVTFYENDGFSGRTFTTQRPVSDLSRFGFNDRASSVIVTRERYEVCDDTRFGGRCVVLRPGRYPSLAAMGLNDRVSSVRTVDTQARIDNSRYSPAPLAAYDYNRRSDERLFEANVTSVRAVVGQAEQRCWVEREQVQGRGDANVPGAVVGAVIGGILGHQIGSGRGNDAATVGGAVVGGAVGSNVGRDGGGQYSKDVRRCETAPSQSRADYWDVTYNFRGKEHRVQMSAPPGRTVSVNSQGEPRG
ncbi:MAG: glycine zipper 2TM domain-containing protein [Burkholderiales bacterium]|nr:glycine zipper 2TM domain-containing protein [Burkholderiales bacterium]